ncbi:ABC transporter ATP-binding protein [Mucilaginibacter sp. UYCu711]|uniref:ABC transporter ATP-binding protein n=1 Tax=Mucilaginibacter sp. UYCu711 TaxID=3156339 RepID=UPI003D20FF59
MKKKITSFSTDLLRATFLLWRVDKKTTVLNMALQGVLALLPIVSLYFMKLLLEAIGNRHRAFETIIPLIIAFGGIQFLLALASQYASYINTIYQEKLTDFLSTEVLMKAVDVSYEYYENPAYHDTLHLAQQQSVSRVSQLFSNFNAIILNTITLAGLIGFFITMHSLFALFFMLLSIPLAVVKWYSGVSLLKMERQFAPLEREANYLHQTLTGVSTAKEVRVFGFGHAFIEKFRKIRKHIHKEKRTLNYRFTLYSLASEAFEIVVMAIVFGILAKQTWVGAITIASFVIYIQGFQRLQGASKGFLQAWVQLFQQRLFLQNIFAFFDIKTTGKETAVSYPGADAGLIINEVSFSYPQSTRVALNKVSLKCEPGKIIAIVGENGCGKSTLVKLLARLYDIQEGTIHLNDEPLDAINLPDFRKNSIFLFQDFEKYFFTIEENVAIGEDEFDPAAIQNAAMLSGAHPFISTLINGYKTRMGRMFTGSEQLSGGQWQKLALARVFYKKAQLVVLDEPTSALDANAEFEVYKNVKEQLKDKMVILITHRLYNLKIADYIYLMHEGSIIEEGSLETLITQSGVFKKMYDAQQL